MTDRAKLEAARSRGFPEALREQIAAWDQLRSGCRSAHDLIRDVHAWLASQPADETAALRADIREFQRNALPSNCTRCNGLGAEPPGCPESGPCERCGGWTPHKLLVAGEAESLRARVRGLEDERDSARAKAIGSKERCAMGDWIKTLRRRRINDTRPFAWIDVDITQRSILDAMRDEPSLKDAEAIRWIRKGKCIGTTSPQRFGSEIYDGDDVDALLARITELESELAARVEPQAEHDRLRWGVVANAGHDSSERMFRWAHVKRNTGLGMTSSIALCREAGFDPDEIVGNEESEEVCDG